MLGRGSGKRHGPSRNVDILLAVPKSKEARGLRATHAYFEIHQYSGAWLLKAGEEEIEVEDDIIRPIEAVTLHRPKTRIRNLDIQYLIRFMIETPENEAFYLNERDQVLREQGLPLPRTKISGIPLANNLMLNYIIFRYRLGSGTFDNVYKGFNPRDRSFRVVKYIILKLSREIPAVK